jgi:hypothetical protein
MHAVLKIEPLFTAQFGTDKNRLVAIVNDRPLVAHYRLDSVHPCTRFSDELPTISSHENGPSVLIQG